MFRVWAKEIKDTHLIKDMVVENDDPNINRTKKVMDALKTVCDEFDLSTPIWLDSSIKDFKRFSKVRFTKDNFIDSIDFDYLEFHVIEE